jgi:hypothetical protein
MMCCLSVLVKIKGIKFGFVFCVVVAGFVVTTTLAVFWGAFGFWLVFRLFLVVGCVVVFRNCTWCHGLQGTKIASSCGLIAKKIIL